MASNMVKGLATGALAGVLAIAAVAVARRAPAAAPEPMALAAALPSGHDTVEVFKTPTCGCCQEWTAYMQKQGFVVVAHDVSADDMDKIKAAAGIPTALASCHTAHVGGYTIEGHVPAEDIRKMLATHPAIAGLAVPGMVSGTPGMGSGPATYSVMAFDAKGNATVYAQH